jgi:uncharacterized protein
MAMNFFRVLMLGAMVAAAGFSNAVAQAPAAAPPSPEALQAAKDLLALISPQTIADMTENATSKVWPQLEAALRQQYPTMDAATLTELRADYERLVSATVADAMTEAPAVYARHFTAPEMQEMTAFYRTPTGAKALKVLPQVTGDLVPVLVPRIQAMQQKLGPIFTEVLQKHGYEKK